MGANPTEVIYGSQDKTVREAVQPLLGLCDIEIIPSGALSGVLAAVVIGNIVQLEHAGFGQVELVLDVTAATTDAGDTLDVLVDCSMNGTIWVNICHFTQCIGTGGAKRLTALIPRTGTAVMADVTADLAAGNMRPFIGSWLRARVTMAEADADADNIFTFSLHACLKP